MFESPWKTAIPAPRFSFSSHDFSTSYAYNLEEKSLMEFKIASLKYNKQIALSLEKKGKRKERVYLLELPFLHRKSFHSPNIAKCLICHSCCFGNLKYNAGKFYKFETLNESNDGFSQMLSEIIHTIAKDTGIG